MYIHIIEKQYVKKNPLIHSYLLFIGYHCLKIDFFSKQKSYSTENIFDVNAKL